MDTIQFARLINWRVSQSRFKVGKNFLNDRYGLTKAERIITEEEDIGLG